MSEGLFSRSGLSQYQYILGFVALACCAGLGVGVARVVTSLYAVALHASELQLGLIAAAQSLGVLLMGLPIGILVHRYGPKRMFALGGVLAAVVYAFIPLYQHTVYLIACTLLISLCMPMRFVSLNTVFMGHLESLGAAKAGWFRGTHMLGFFLLGPLLAVSLIDSAGFAGAFWWVACIFVIPAFFAPLAFAGFQPKDSAAKAPKLGWCEIGQQLRLFKQDRELRYTSAIEMLSNSVMAYYGFFIIVIAIKNYGFSEAAAASLVTAQGSVFVLALFSMGVFLVRWGVKRFYQLGFALVAFASFCLAAPAGPALLWLGSFALGIGLGMLHIVNFTMFAKVGERLGIARVSGLTAMVGPTGGLLGGILGGWLGHRWGLQSLFLPMAVVFTGLIWLVHNMQRFALVPQPDIEILTNADGQ